VMTRMYFRRDIPILRRKEHQIQINQTQDPKQL